MSKFYYLSSVVVFPGFATLSTHFAMCFGKPLICSQYGNEAEYVIDNLNGFTYAYGDVNDLACKIEMVLDDESLLRRFGSESLRIVEEKINVRHMVSTIADQIRNSIR